MATLNFRLPMIRLEQRSPQREALQRPSAQPAMPARCSVAMDAEAAALIALRRLGARDRVNHSRTPPTADELVTSGWFDSTWELSHGLDIAEGLPCDLPLDGWLLLYLAK